MLNSGAAQSTSSIAKFDLKKNLSEQILTYMRICVVTIIQNEVTKNDI